MKKLFTVLLLFCAAAAFFSLAACAPRSDTDQPGPPEVPEHTHTGTQLSYDAEAHRYLCEICGQAFQNAAHTEDANGLCSVCGCSCSPTEGLLFSENAGNDGYTLIGAGDAARATEIRIPSFYEGKPVCAVASDALAGANAMERLIIPAGIEDIPEGTFRNCLTLREIVVAPQNTVYCDQDGALYTEDRSVLLQYPAGQKADTVLLPDGIERIGDYALSCSAAAVISLPETVCELGNSAFSACSQLREIALPDNISEIPEYAFSNCLQLQELTFPKGVVSIGDFAFRGCSSLQSLALPSSLTQIGTAAFERCSLLRSANLPSAIETIEAMVFFNCTSLEELTLPDHVRSLGYMALGNCTSLQAITLPASLQTMDTYALTGCSGLKAIEVAAENRSYRSLDGVLYSADGTQLLKYPSAHERTSFIPPQTVQTVADSAFENCQYLEEIALPDPVTDIGGYAFTNCSALAQISFGENLAHIGAGAFSACPALVRAAFTDPDGWDIGGEPLSAQMLADPAQAAELLTTRTEEWQRA